MPSCPYCGGTDIATNDARGEKACMTCGAVVEEGVMVESIGFTEGSGMNGQYVSFIAGRGGGSNASREQCLARGRNNIQRIADILRIPSTQQDAAHRLFVMAVQRNFTIGRPGLHVAAACLYVIARREKSPQLLIDFSDVLRTPVKTLGQVFMKLVRTLHLPIPHIDPSLFLERYAAQMQLGEKTSRVATTGVRIIQALTRDWISTGRRPTGLCGAALLISARLNGFKINGEDIAHIVRISGHTIHKRLYEFRQTSAAALTTDEFESADLTTLPILKGPPCFEAAKRRKARIMLAYGESIEDSSGLDESPLPITEGCSAAKEISETAPAEKGVDANSEPVMESEAEAARRKGYDPVGDAECPAGPLLDLAKTPIPTLGTRLALDLTDEEMYKKDPTSTDIENIAAKMIRAIGDVVSANSSSVPSEQGGEGDLSINTKTGGAEGIPGAVAEEASAALLDDLGVIDGAEVNAGCVASVADTEKAQPETQSTCADTQDRISDDIFGDDSHEGAFDQSLGDLLLEITNRCGDLVSSSPPTSVIPCKEGASVNSNELSAENACEVAVVPAESKGNDASALVEKTLLDGDETLSDVSDSEIDALLLTEEERKIKELIWDDMTKNIMPEVHRRMKSKKRKEQEAQGMTKRRRKERPALPEAASAADSVRLAFQQKAVGASKRINDDVLDSLFSESTLFV